jgi:hypothetical protein
MRKWEVRGIEFNHWYLFIVLDIAIDIGIIQNNSIFALL